MLLVAYLLVIDLLGPKAPLLAGELSPDQWAQFGLAGIVLIWFMVRNEKKLEAIDVALTRVQGAIEASARAQLIEALRHTDDAGLKAEIERQLAALTPAAPTIIVAPK